jgi:hypothetical protein
VARTYSQDGPSLQLTYKPDGRETSSWQSVSPKTIGIGVPVQISGIAEGTAVNLDAVQVTAEAADGRRWKSRWESLWGARYRPDTDPDLAPPLPVQFDRVFFEREQRNPVTLHLRLATTVMRANTPIRLAMPAHEFTVPGFGICVPLDPIAAGDYTDLSCRNALRQPAATLVEVQWSNAPCGTNGTTNSMPMVGEAWAGALTSEPATFGIDGVEQVPLDISNREQLIAGHNAPRHLCPDAPMAFTTYAVERRTEYDVTFANYQLPERSGGLHVNN